MKMIKALITVLPVYVLLSACGAKPDPSSVTRSQAAAPVVKSADQTNTPTEASPQKVDVADLQAQKADLEAQKSSLLTQQKDIENQMSSFAQPADLKGAAFGDFMANAQALPAIDQAALDDIIQAAMDMDLAALQIAIQDLIADLQDAVADLQAQIDDLAAQIAAVQP
ncbi:MAG TPA: hypothetical protein VE954_35970 [Oligoflexus sp.]|uniref:hypothetical protein n=1 Tax=Oligoflexus sp. TaxID=1971216 RepID=UPI002D5F831B|nr:hypothetical protein [Oligoflexus sp.]HYX38531.1 hypothetical protein [Oligoflexus sp.]